MPQWAPDSIPDAYQFTAWLEADLRDNVIHTSRNLPRMQEGYTLERGKTREMVQYQVDLGWIENVPGSKQGLRLTDAHALRCILTDHYIDHWWTSREARFTEPAARKGLWVYRLTQLKTLLPRAVDNLEDQLLLEAVVLAVQLHSCSHFDWGATKTSPAEAVAEGSLTPALLEQRTRAALEGTQHDLRLLLHTLVNVGVPNTDDPLGLVFGILA